MKALQAQIIAAGGAITGTFTAGDKLIDAAERSLIDSAGSQLAAQLVDPRVETTAPSYELMGQLLGVAMSTTQASSVRADLAAVSVRESLAGAELLTSPEDVRSAPLVLIVLPPARGGGRGVEPGDAHHPVRPGEWHRSQRRGGGRVVGDGTPPTTVSSPHSARAS